MKANGFRDLAVWQRAMDLVVEWYRAVQGFPKYETYGLSDQLRCAAVSVPANIAEGQGRWRGNDFSRYLAIAYGSLAEVETHVEIAKRLNYITEQSYIRLLDRTTEIAKMINGLNRSLKKTDA